MLIIQPNAEGSLNGRSSGRHFRPRRQLIATGMPYDKPSATTEAAVIALNAEVDPKKIQPKMITTTVVKINELSGMPRPLWTLANTLEKGRPLSRANAHVILEDVVMIPQVANSKQIKGNSRRQVAPEHH